VRNEEGRLPGRPSENPAAAKLPGSAVHSRVCRTGSAPVTLAALSAALRDYGIHQADEGIDVWWKSCADRAIAYLAALDQPFSSDDVQALIPAADHPCRMGARFRTAVLAGTIRPVGYVLSSRPSRHRGVQRLYRSGPSADTGAASLASMKRDNVGGAAR
jgi:hypothetical protein